MSDDDGQEKRNENELPFTVAKYLQRAPAKRSPATTALYGYAVADFTNWALGRNLRPIPPISEKDLLSWVAESADRGLSHKTLLSYLCGLADWHRANDLDFERPALLKKLLLGIRRHQRRPTKKARALSPVEIADMCKGLGFGVRDCRDRAMILLGFAGALRVGEICAARVEDWRPGSLAVPESKTDRLAVGTSIEIAKGTDEKTCPWLAMDRWLAIRGAREGGPIFTRLYSGAGRGGHVVDFQLRPLGLRGVEGAIKRAAALSGVDDTDVSTHSLRASWITAAYKAGFSEERIQVHTRHKTRDVLRGYYRDRDPLKSLL